MAVYDTTLLGSGLEFDTSNSLSKSVIRIPGLDRIAIAWVNSTTTVYVQAFNVNKSTGAITAIGSPLDIEPGTAGTGATGISLVAIDTSNLAVFWSGASDDGYCQLFSIDGTGNITTNGSAVEYDIASGLYPTAVLMDSTHILNAWQGTGADGFACIFTVNTGTGTITKTGTEFEFDAADYSYGSIAKLSATKAILFYVGVGADGFAIVLSVDTSTWAVTAAGSAFEFLDAATMIGNSCVVIDSTSSPMVVANSYVKASAGGEAVRTFNIDTSTWAITAFGAELVLAASVGSSYATSLVKSDNAHLLVAYINGTNGNANIRSLTYNNSTGELTNTANTTEYVAANTSGTSLVDLGDYAYTVATTGDASDGFAFTILVETYKLVCETGTFALTGVSVNLKSGFRLIAETGIFLLNSVGANLKFIKWRNAVKNISNWLNQDKS